MKKICLVTPCILPVPAVQGGAIETLVTMLVEQNEIAHKVNLIIVSYESKEARQLSKDYKYTRIIYMKTKPENDKLFYLKRNLLIMSVRPDYIVAEGGNYSSFVLLSRLFGRERMFLHLHHEMYGFGRILQTFGTMIAVSDFIKQGYAAGRKEVLDSSVVVKNCVDEKKFRKRITLEQREHIRKELGFREDDFVAIFCGRIIKEKGVEELIDAVNRIEEHKIKLLLIGSINFGLEGDSDYLQRIRSKVDKSNGKIKFSGYVPHKELYQFYQASDLQIVPSIWDDPAPLVVLEGILSELPVISARSGGIPEYLEGAGGVLVDKGNAINDESAAADFSVKLEREILELYYNVEKRNELKELMHNYGKDISVKKYYDDFTQVFTK